MPTPATAGSATHADFDLHVVDGTWPSDITGEVIFSAPRISGNLPYGLFDFGVLIRLSLVAGTHGAGPDRFAWRVGDIETPGKRIHDRCPAAFSASPVGYQSPVGPPNSANTAPLPWGERLFATWDGGRPVEVHPGTLEYVADVGHTDSWGGPSMFGDTVLPFILSSAHPVVDPDRDGLWTAKLDPVLEPTFGMRPSVAWWDGAGTDMLVWPLEGVQFDGSLHTMSQTRDWVILSESGNFKADPGEMMGGERAVTVDDKAPVWLLRKDEVLATPPGSPVTPTSFTVAPPSGHFYARYDDTDGVSVVWEGMDLVDLGLHIRPDDVDLTGEPVRPADVGLYNMAMGSGTISELQFDPESGTVLERGVCRGDWTFNLQLSAMDWSTEGISDPRLHHVCIQGARPGRVTQRAADLYADRIDADRLAEDTPGYLASFERGSMEVKARWEYADTSELVTSPAFAPRDAGADPSASAHAGTDPGGHEGYVLQPVLSDNGFRVDLFDASKVGAGPIASLRGTSNECVPTILHSAWTPAHDALVDAKRLRFSDEATDARLGALEPEIADVVRAVAEELDG